MSREIITHTFSDTEQAMRIGNAQVARKFEIGNDWTRIRIGCRVNLSDSGANLTGTPRLWFGLMSNPTAPTLTNGPLNAGSVSHFLGMRTISASWTRSTGPTRYGVGNNGIQATKMVGATATTAAADGTNLNFRSGSTRKALMVEITKGSPNFTVAFSGLVSTSNATDILYSHLEAAMENQDLTSASSSLGNSTSPNSWTLAVDENTDGPLNALVFAYDRTTNLFSVSELVFSVYA